MERHERPRVVSGQRLRPQRRVCARRLRPASPAGAARARGDDQDESDIGVGLTMNSAGPYTEYLARDIYNNGRGGARPPGVARNTLVGAGFAQLDLRASRSFSVGATQKTRAVALALDAFNVLNRDERSDLRRHARIAFFRSADFRPTAATAAVLVEVDVLAPRCRTWSTGTSRRRGLINSGSPTSRTGLSHTIRPLGFPGRLTSVQQVYGHFGWSPRPRRM